MERGPEIDAGRRVVTTSIPPEVVSQVEELVRFRPDPPEGLAIELVRDPRFHVLLGALPILNVVDGVRLDEDGVERAVRDVRELLRARGRNVAAWHVSSASTPTDLEPRLLALGLASSSDPPFEPEWAAMATVGEPVGTVSSGVVARAIEGIEEMRLASEIMAEGAGLGEAGLRALEAHLSDFFALHESGDGRAYLAFVDGEPVGSARASFLPHGVNLSGSAVLPQRRGRGAYRALVAARWRDAVARGTPALTIQAGAMSRPILERLGFEVVSMIRVLVDRF